MPKSKSARLDELLLQPLIALDEDLREQDAQPSHMLAGGALRLDRNASELRLESDECELILPAGRLQN